MSDGFLTALAAIANALFLVGGLYIYLSLVRQIQRRSSDASEDALTRTFGWPDALVAFLLSILFALNATTSGSDGRIVLGTRDLIFNGLISAGLFVFIAAFLNLRGVNVGVLAGFPRLGLRRVVFTGGILLFAAYPLIYLADQLTQRVLGGSTTKQGIVELFSGSQTIQQRVLIIILAVAIAPLVEEFVFRFYLYGVCKRYLGRLTGLLVNSVLFSAVHAHIPSAAPLFVLGACFTLAYEWSGSILVSMSMHALFNSFTLVALAFPEAFPQQ